MSAALALEQVRSEMERLGDKGALPQYVERFDFRMLEEGAHVFFYGDPSGKAYGYLVEAICEEPISNSLLSLSLDGPDEGANGTRNWDLSILAKSPTPFPALRHFSITQGKPDDHNRTIVGKVYDEEGTIGDIVAKAPSLESLVLPSAPFKNFFAIRLERLSKLSVDAGYDTQNFIENLASSSFAPNLQSLTWGEYAETYMDDWTTCTTPYSDMVELFRSTTFDSVRCFFLKNPLYSDEAIRQLASIRPNLQFMVVRTSSAYVRS